jgi:hypothetical protein
MAQGVYVSNKHTGNRSDNTLEGMMTLKEDLGARKGL